jgi:hypothetical protein
MGVFADELGLVNIVWISVRSLVTPYFIPEMLYKLGINKNEIGKNAK